MVAFTVGIVLGGFSVQGYSAEWLKQAGLIVAILAALGTGCLNLIKLQEMKQQQRWELQKPMLLGLLKSLMRLIDLIRDVDNHFFMMTLSEGQISSSEQKWHEKQYDRLIKEQGLIYKDVKLVLKELDEVWSDSLPEYVTAGLQEYKDEMKKIKQNEEQGYLTTIEAEVAEADLMEAFLPALRRACVELSGVLKS